MHTIIINLLLNYAINKNNLIYIIYYQAIIYIEIIKMPININNLIIQLIGTYVYTTTQNTIKMTNCTV